MADMIDIIETQGHHWTIWTCKDIGKMGIVYPDPESEWMRRTRPVRQAKTALRRDSWIERQPGEIDQILQQIVASAPLVAPDQSVNWEGLQESLSVSVHDGVFAQALLPAFAEQFQGMSETDIDRMMQSFAFQNCIQRHELAQLLKRKLGQ